MAANNNNNNNNGPAEAPTWFDEWSARTPPVTRFTLFATLGASIVCWVLGLSMVLANCPLVTVLHFQPWRLLTAPFVSGSLISLLFGTFIFASMAPKREQAMGSLGFLLLVLTYAWGTQLLYSTLIFVLAFNPIYPAPMLGMSCSSGLGVVWLGLMAQDCAEEPEQERRVLFLPVQVKNKYYPFILVGIFSLLFGIQFDSFAALGVGYLYAWDYLSFVKPSPERLRALETGRLSGMAQWMGYVAVDQAGVPQAAPGADVERGRAGGSVFARGRGGAAPARGPAGAAPAGPPTAFPGSGHSLGSAPGTRGSGGAGYGGGGGASGGGKGGSSGSSSKGKGKGGATVARPAASAPARSEVLAALERRLAAQSDPPASAGAAPSSSGGSMELKLLQMQELGFDRGASLAALQQTNGDVDRAASLLSST